MIDWITTILSRLLGGKSKDVSDCEDNGLTVARLRTEIDAIYDEVEALEEAYDQALDKAQKGKSIGESEMVMDRLLAELENAEDRRESARQKLDIKRRKLQQAEHEHSLRDLGREAGLGDSANERELAIAEAERRKQEKQQRQEAQVRKVRTDAARDKKRQDQEQKLRNVLGGNDPQKSSGTEEKPTTKE